MVLTSDTVINEIYNVHPHQPTNVLNAPRIDFRSPSQQACRGSERRSQTSASRCLSIICFIRCLRCSISGLTITTEYMLYWADGKLGRIERCRLDGSARQLLYSRPGDHYRGLALSPCSIYVTDQTKR